ncbi:hypothetical protein Tco_0221162 [Tanacetum coccineum]
MNFLSHSSVILIALDYEDPRARGFVLRALELQSLTLFKEVQFRNQDNTRKQGNNEDTSKAMLAIDGVGFDWSNMAEEQVQTNMALMAFSDLEASTYKRGLDTVEAQLVTYKKNEVLFSEEVAVLKREVGCKQYKINMIKTEFEKVKQEKDGINFKIEKFDKASKDFRSVVRKSDN